METVLGGDLQAVATDRFDELAQTLTAIDQGSVTLIDANAAEASGGRDTLANFVSGAGAVQALLASVYVADSVSAALSRRATLAPHESVITSDGLWFGSGWVRAQKEQNAAAGVLARQQELELLSAQSDQDQEQAEQLAEQLEATLAAKKRCRLSVKIPGANWTNTTVSLAS